MLRQYFWWSRNFQKKFDNFYNIHRAKSGKEFTISNAVFILFYFVLEPD